MVWPVVRLLKRRRSLGSQ